MDFDYSPRVKDLLARLRAFMDAEVRPADPAYRAAVDRGDYPIDLIDGLKAKARPPACGTCSCRRCRTTSRARG